MRIDEHAKTVGWILFWVVVWFTILFILITDDIPDWTGILGFCILASAVIAKRWNVMFPVKEEDE